MYDRKHGELVMRINACTRRLGDLVLPELSPDLVSPLLALPAVRGVWVGSVASGGDWHDISGHGNHLSYQGNLEHTYSGVVPNWKLDGTGDYFSITDAASGNDFDVLGTEAYIAAAARGLTVMLWCYVEETGTLENLIAKWGAAGSRAYRLFLNATDQFVMRFSDDGTNSDGATSSAVTMDAWYFVAGRVDPGSSVDVFVGSSTGLEETNQATARASIRNTATDLNVGARAGGTEPFQGRVALCAVCAAQLSNSIISSVFEQTRAAFRI
jgi:hypothetical protein